jgi:hypothetical protein
MLCNLCNICDTRLFATTSEVCQLVAKWVKHAIRATYSRSWQWWMRRHGWMATAVVETLTAVKVIVAMTE